MYSFSLLIKKIKQHLSVKWFANLVWPVDVNIIVLLCVRLIIGWLNNNIKNTNINMKLGENLKLTIYKRTQLYIILNLEFYDLYKKKDMTRFFECVTCRI